MLLRQLPGGSETPPPPVPAAGLGADRGRTDARAATRRDAGLRRCLGTTTRLRHARDLDRWISILRAAPMFAFDTETTSSTTCRRRSSACHSPRARTCGVRSVAHDYAGAPGTAPPRGVLRSTAAAARGSAGAQARPAPEVRRARARQPRHRAQRGMRFDTMLESYVLDSTARGTTWTRTRETLSRRSRRCTTRTSPARARDSSRSTRCRSDRAAEYAAEDADVTLRLHQRPVAEAHADARARAAVRGDRAAARTSVEANGASTAC